MGTSQVADVIKLLQAQIQAEEEEKEQKEKAKQLKGSKEAEAVQSEEIKNVADRRDR